MLSRPSIHDNQHRISKKIVNQTKCERTTNKCKQKLHHKKTEVATKAGRQAFIWRQKLAGKHLYQFESLHYWAMGNKNHFLFPIATLAYLWWAACHASHFFYGKHERQIILVCNIAEDSPSLNWPCFPISTFPQQ